MYATEKWSMLLAMVVMGATRQIAVKLLYQTGFDSSNYVTLLYLFGYSLPLIPYLWQPWRMTTDQTAQEADEEEGFHQDKLVRCKDKQIIGSGHGLEDALEEEAKARVNQIPFLLQPLILGILTMLNALLRWASLIYIAASVSIMLISGMELALSVVAARWIRQRKVSARRWLGVGVVVVGITVIGAADVLLGDASESSSVQNQHTSRERSIGIALILGKSLVKMLQDITEEMFMQVGEFPATLLLGLEGAFGFAVAVVLFFAVGDAMGDGPTKTLAMIQENSNLVWYSIGLALLFTATGLANIKATQVTCAMTRNVWKNMRTALVWIIALLIYYLGGNEDLGEAFVIPDSLVILAGFVVMVVGISVYYGDDDKAKEEAESKNTASDAVATEATYLMHAHK